MINNILKVLNIGSGVRPFIECINADINPEKNLDWVVDVCDTPWNKNIDT